MLATAARDRRRRCQAAGDVPRWRYGYSWSDQPSGVQVGDHGADLGEDAMVGVGGTAPGEQAGGLFDVGAMEDGVEG